MSTFANLIAPKSEADFFQDYFGARFLHIPATNAKFPNLMPWAKLNDLLSQSGLWSRETLLMTLNKEQVHPNLYCRVREARGGGQGVVPDAARVMDLVKRGATLNLLHIDSLSPELRAIANGLRETLGMYTQANLYCSWAGVQAFQAHCDPHDAWVFHTEGEKRWRIYDGRAENPIRHDSFDKAMTQPTEKERGELVAEIILKPGDVLYIPRGIYHEALALTPGTVHVTFGCFGLVGLDMLNLLWPMLVRDKDFRAFLPRLNDPKSEQAWAKRVKELGQKLGGVMAGSEFQDALKVFAKDRARLNPEFKLPER